MSVPIKVFYVGGKRFTHFVNTAHDSVELRDECNEILLIYGPDAKVSNRDGRIGIFHCEFIDGQVRWVYYEISDQVRIVCGPDLPTAKVEVSRRYIGLSEMASADCSQFAS